MFCFSIHYRIDFQARLEMSCSTLVFIVITPTHVVKSLGGALKLKDHSVIPTHKQCARAPS